VKRAYVGFGANLGDPSATLRAAAVVVGERTGAITAGSRIYRSTPVGLVDQPDFRNAVAGVRTALSAERLLAELNAVEAEFGRVRDVRFGPRTLDLDLIWYEGEEREDAHLTLPHPRAHEREFVLRPLAELAPGLVLRGATVAEWLAGMTPQGVEATAETLM
jgi:2-amino-4-hydroxy-6-hydroxymethyldihydropteridine diphosphokinase